MKYAWDYVLNVGKLGPEGPYAEQMTLKGILSEPEGIHKDFILEAMRIIILSSIAQVETLANAQATPQESSQPPLDTL